MKLEYKGQMRKLRAVKSEGSQEGIGTMSFGWRRGKKVLWKIAPGKDTIFFCMSSTERVSVLKEPKQVSSSVSFPLTCQLRA